MRTFLNMEALVGVALLVGMFLAFKAGTAVQALRHAVDTLRKTEASIPGLKKTASSTRWRSWGRLLLMASYVVIPLFIYILIKMAT